MRIDYGLEGPSEILRRDRGIYPQVGASGFEGLEPEDLRAIGKAISKGEDPEEVIRGFYEAKQREGLGDDEAAWEITRVLARVLWDVNGQTRNSWVKGHGAVFGNEQYKDMGEWFEGHNCF